MKFYSFLTALCFSFFTLTLVAQDVENEIDFIYLKAQYLLEKGRAQDAIIEYDKVLSKNANYKDAFVKRLQAKFDLEQYANVKNDIISNISKYGVNPDAVRLLGMSDYNLGNYAAAVNTLISAHRIYPQNVEIVEALADSATKSRSANACDVLDGVSNSAAVAEYLSKVCNGQVEEYASKPPRDTKKELPPRNSKASTKKTDKSAKNTTKKKPKINVSDSGLPEDVLMGGEKPVDEAVNKVVIDEDLTIILDKGIGSRQIIDQPQILMLSTEAGQVAVDVCITKGGRVESAELNKALTDIAKESLQSLAMRKAKEFWFKRGTEAQECGTITFVINGGKK